MASCSLLVLLSWQVSQTCEIALNLIEWRAAGSQGEAPMVCACMMSPYVGP